MHFNEICFLELVNKMVATGMATKPTGHDEDTGHGGGGGGHKSGNESDASAKSAGSKGGPKTKRTDFDLVWKVLGPTRI